MLVEGGSEVPKDCIHLVILLRRLEDRIRSLGWQSPRFLHIE
jgi:hypothetical protein